MKPIYIIALVWAFFHTCKPSQETASTPSIKPGVIEITEFKLKATVSDEDFKASARKIQTEFLEKQKGYLKRTLAVSKEKVWTDIVYWENQKSFEDAGKLAEKSEAAQPFMETIDFKTLKFNLLTPVISE
ncbi:MAG: hypothetical protein O9264_02850 [Leptospira sp.]|nr:hypothetical protein [Leptospira sp.]